MSQDNMSHDPVPLVDIRAIYARLKDDIDARLAQVLASGGFVLGPEVTALEEALAARAGVGHAVGVASGTDALALPLLAAGVGPGDAVFVPSFTYLATATAVMQTGATPVFCDVDPESFHLDAADMARRLAVLPEGLRPRAVIPVDLFGLPYLDPALEALAGAHGLLVLADAAQSFGATRSGRPVGALAPVSATSFYPTKPLGGFGDGGAILTDDAALAGQLRALRMHGQEGGVARLPGGLNSRLDTMQAAVLLARLEVFDEDLARRREIARAYDEALAGRVGLQARPEDAQSTFAVYAVLSNRRDALRAALVEAGIGTRVYYEEPVHRMPAMGHPAGAAPLPVSERLCTEALALPIYAEMSDSQLERVIDVVRAAL